MGGALPSKDSSSPKNTSTILPSTKPPTYTTVGSVYNPQGTPLQPPTRRGRTLRWPYGSPADIAGLPKSLLANLPTKGRQSPPTTASSLQQYSPLQQNYDRAASPVIASNEQDRASLLNPIKVDRGSKPTPVTMAPPPGFPVPAAWPAAAEFAANNELQDHDDEDDSGDMAAAEHVFRQLGVKGITNLASYENPMQKAAQKKLARARIPLVTGGPNALNSSTAPSGTRDILGLGKDSKITPALLRAARTDPSVLTGVDMGKHGPDRADLVQNHPDLLSYSQLQGSETHQAEAVQPPTGPASRFTTLATGPGAPRPLTAGPPGQRQYKAATFEGCLKRLQEGIEKSTRPARDDIKSESGLISAVSDGRPGSTLPYRALSSRGAQSLATKQDPIGALVLRSAQGQYPEAVNGGSHGVRDTLPVEEAAKYFPNGFPSNYDFHSIETIPAHWADKYPLHDRKHWRRSSEEIRRHNAKVNACFYSGNPLLGKTMDAASREADRRQFDREVGVSNEERERALNRELQLVETFNISGSRRTVYSHLSIEEVNSQDTSEAADPLLNMAFATLLSYQEDDGEKKTISGWDLDPLPSYIDRDPRSQKSIFGPPPLRSRTV